jgi:hypothetical protein
MDAGISSPVGQGFLYYYFICTARSQEHEEKKKRSLPLENLKERNPPPPRNKSLRGRPGEQRKGKERSRKLTPSLSQEEKIPSCILR